MAKVILEFDLIEDREEMYSAINGWKYEKVIYDLDQHLRSEVKYNDNLSEEVSDALDELRNKIREFLHDNGLTFE
jgi:hypothetical protein